MISSIQEHYSNRSGWTLLGYVGDRQDARFPELFLGNQIRKRDLDASVIRASTFFSSIFSLSFCNNVFPWWPVSRTCTRRWRQSRKNRAGHDRVCLKFHGVHRVMHSIFVFAHRLDTVTDFFNRMVQYVNWLKAASYLLTKYLRSCHAKCISPRYADGDLNKGESVCIDRCVAKFNEVQKKVGEKLQSRSQANAPPGSAPGGFGSF
jgi:import inner membrane translocase subunit TIM10